MMSLNQKTIVNKMVTYLFNRTCGQPVIKPVQKIHPVASVAEEMRIAQKIGKKIIDLSKC